MKKKMWRTGLCGLTACSMLFSMPALAWAADEPQNTGIEDGLIAYYDFENVNEKKVPNVQDQSKYEGTLSGDNVSVAENTIFGKSLKFTAGNQGMMEIPQIMNTSQKSYSISLWFKYDTSTNREGKNTVLLQQNGNGRTFLQFTKDNKYATYVNASNVYSDKAVDLSQWQHVMATYNKDTKKIAFYINGEKDSEKDAGSQVVNELTSLLIGRHKNGGNDPLSMRGLVDEIRVYEKVLTADEAKAVYEEKAGAMLFPQLTEQIKAAEELDASGKLDENADAAKALKTAIADAKKLSDSSALSEISAMIKTLEDAMKNYRAEIGVVLTVSPETEERSIDSATIGINHRYAFNGYGSFDSTTMTMKDEFAELYKDAGFGSIRYPGGTISNLFRWKESIGPKDERVKQIHGFYNNPNQAGIAPNFGLTEVADFAYRDDVQSEIVYVYGFGRGSAQDAADLVEYLNAPAGSNPGGGVAWADVRKENGHAEPYNVRYFEIGNENNQGGDDGTASQQYWMSKVDGGAEKAYVEGGVASFTKQYAVKEDNWNKAASVSDGTANQVRYMRYANPNPMTGEDGKTLKDDFEAVKKGSVEVWVGVDGNNEQWTIVDSLESAGADEKKVTIDYRDGSIHFGDGTHGKIPAQGQQIYVTYKVQRDGFVAVSKAMKDMTAEINEINASNGSTDKASCYVYSSFETQGFINRMQSGGWNEYYDGLTIHPYCGNPGENNPDNEFYDNAMKLAEDVGIKKVQDYVNMLPDGKVPVISEYGIFRCVSPRLRSQTHAVYIAKVLMEYVRLGSPYIQKHCLVDWYSDGADSLGPTQQAVIQAVPQEGADRGTGEGNFRFFSTPSAKVFELFSNSFSKGTKVVGTEFEHVETLANGTKAYSAIASKGEDGTLYVAVVNTDRVNDKKLHVKVDGVDLTGKKVTIQTLAGENFADENSLTEPNKVALETTELTAESAELNLTAKAHSVMTITVKEKEEPPVEETFTVTAKANNADMGDVALSPAKEKYNAGEEVTATATAKEGYEFVDWTVDGQTVEGATYKFTVEKNTELTANFKEKEKPVETFTVTVKANDNNMGTVAIDPKKDSYVKGEEVTVIAEAKEGYEFVNWTVGGKELSKSAAYQITVDKDMDLIANFKEKEKPAEKFTVTVKANDDKKGSVTLNPVKEKYNAGEEVTATAAAKEGYRFVNWTVDGKEVSKDAVYRFEVTGALNLKANFEKITAEDTFKLNVDVNDNKMGTAKLDPAKESYKAGEIVTAIAKAKEGYKFVNWTVDGKAVSDKAEYKFEVDRAVTLKANFTKTATDPTPENPKNEDKAVQTGDNSVSPIIPLAGLMLAAGAAVAALRKKED
jgi:alpha-L-arabinofuranosidase